MSTIFNPTGFTLSEEQIKAVSEALFESGFSKPALTDFHNVIEGIIVNKQLPILGRLNGLLGGGSGECDPESSSNTFGGTMKHWTPKMISDRLEQCWSDLETTFWAYTLKLGLAKADVTGTDFMNYVVTLVEDAIVEAIFRIVWFSDEDVETVVNLGTLTNGTPLKYFDKLNGFWRQVFEVVAATPARRTLGIDGKNSQATYALQEFNDADTTNLVVTKLLQNMRFGADMRLRGRADLMYVVTQSVADQYERELIYANVNYTTERLENGITVLKSAGHTVYGFDFWDRMIRTYFDDGSAYFLPHRALLYTPSNFYLGTENQGTLSDLDIFYDKIKKVNYIDFAFKIDAKLGLDYEFQAGY